VAGLKDGYVNGDLGFDPLGMCVYVCMCVCVYVYMCVCVYVSYGFDPLGIKPTISIWHMTPTYTLFKPTLSIWKTPIKPSLSMLHMTLTPYLNPHPFHIYMTSDPHTHTTYDIGLKPKSPKDYAQMVRESVLYQ
jgi:hypothetical protein